MRLIGEPDLLCIDWDERLLRVVNAGFSRGAPFVRGVFTQAVPPGLDVRDPQAMGLFIRTALAEHRMRRTKRAIIAVPRQDAVLTLLNLPRGTTDELAAMVHMQVGREMPFARDQAVIDFAVARMEENTPTCEVWAAAVRSSLIGHLEQVMSAAGLKVERIGLRAHANLVAARAEGELPTRTVTVDVGPSMTEINVIRDGRLVFSRAASVSIPPGGLMAAAAPPASAPASGDGAIPFIDDSAPRPRALDSLLVEVSRTIEAYRATDPGARMDRIVLAGSGGITPDTASAFESRFGVSTEIFRPPDSMLYDFAGAGSTAPLSVAIGLALSGKGQSVHHFNFAHPKEPEAEHRERRRRVPAKVSIGAAAVLAAGVFAYMPIHKKNAEIEMLRRQYNQANADARERDELSKQIADLKGWQAKNVIWLDTLREIAADIFTTNKDAYFTRLDFNGESGQIRLNMVAVDEMVAGDLANNARRILDGREKPVYSEAKPGHVEKNLADPKYPVKDEVFVTVGALAPKQRSGRQ